MTDRFIFHLVAAAAFDPRAPAGAYVPGSHEQDGCIHCTRGAETLRLVANTFYQDTAGDFLARLTRRG